MAKCVHEEINGGINDCYTLNGTSNDSDNALVLATFIVGLDQSKPSHVQPPVTFPIGDHVNVLHDYKKTGPSKILKLLICCCHHLTDMLIEISQSLILVTHLKCLNVPYPSIFTNLCMNYYAHVPCCEKIAKYPSAY